MDAELASVLADSVALIAIRTANPPGNEGLAASWLVERLRRCASQIALQPVSPGRDNVVATFDFGPGPTVLLCTHLDVVPPQNDEQWQAVVEDGRLYGRGACDAKGVLAVMVAACERLLARTDLSGRLVLAAVADEESNATGAQALVRSGLAADVAVVGEPTESRLVLSSRGAVRLSVAFSGRAAHASNPGGGVSALYPAARFALAIEALNAHLAERPSHGSCAATVVHGGSKLNVIPDACTIQVDRRLGLGEATRSAIDEIESLAAAAIDGTLATYETAPAGVWLEPFETSSSLPAVRAMLDMLGQREAAAPFVAGTDAPHFVSIGIPTAIFGPGSLSIAHSASESVGVAELAAAVEGYERIARSVLQAVNSPTSGRGASPRGRSDS